MQLPWSQGCLATLKPGMLKGLRIHGQRPVYTEGSLTIETSRPTWTTTKPSTQTKPIDPRTQPLLQHTSKQERQEMSLLLLLCLVVTSLRQNDGHECRMLTSYCQLHKKRSKNTCHSKKSFLLCGDVCLVSCSIAFSFLATPIHLMIDKSLLQRSSKCLQSCWGLEKS
jgi:hypothetical protein